MQTSEFDFHLPVERIAQKPAEPRDQSRLMVVSRDALAIEHRVFSDLPNLLREGDCLVRNNTQVIPARLLGVRESTKGKWQGLYLRTLTDGNWEILASTRGHPKAGERIVIEGGLCLTLISQGEAGRWVVRPDSNESALKLLDQFGHVPLPPYIRQGKEDVSDRSCYQTIFASQPGAVAAPTAGLHFTENVLDHLRERRIPSYDITLHVGIGTFRPIEVDAIEDHVLHAEWGNVSIETADLLQDHRQRGGRIVAVGTTSARTLETSARDGHFAAFSGDTALYLKPGHVFRGINALLTNFHLPRSSLLVLVSAFAGVDLIREAYSIAIREEYRFYSYGDAMLIL